jgi:hypothetical protein
MGRTREQVLAVTAGRDRVIDAVKAGALCLVILGHSLAWTVAPDGTASNTLEAAPGAAPLTWVLQTLPLFFLVAGPGLARVGAAPTAERMAGRIERLAAPALPLMAVTLVLALAAGALVSPDAGAAAGLLPTQLLWFLGVYLMLVVLSPILVRLHSPWWLLVAALAIGAVDALRVNVDTTLGWINLVLVWSLFAGAGMQLPALRALPRGVLATALVVSVAGAVALVMLGPYSSALITTTASPGITNLAPPTLVLALAGSAQVCVLLLAWPLLERLLRRDAVWVAVAVFASRAMELYLWHMLGFTLAIGVVLGTGIAPLPLSLGWWLLHLAVLVVVVGIVWLAAPVLSGATTSLAAWLGRRAPTDIVRRDLRVGIVAAIVAGLALLAASESGMAAPLTPRIVIVLPYVPVVALAMLTVVVGLAAGRRPRHP